MGPLGLAQTVAVKAYGLQTKVSASPDTYSLTPPRPTNRAGAQQPEF